MKDVLRTLTRNTLRRSPVSTLVLVLFVGLAAMLASSAAALVITASGAAQSLMEQARTPHFLQMHAGEVDEEQLAEFAAGNALVEDFAAVPMLNVDGTGIRVTGAGTDTTLAAGLQDNSFVAQSEGFDLLLDTDGQVIDPEPGTVWLPLYYRELLDLSGDETVTVSGRDGTPAATLQVAGFLRDSQMNASYASSKRLLVAQPDLDALRGALGESGTTEYLVQFRLTSPAAVSEFETAYRAAGLESNGPTLTWSLFVLVNTLSVGITTAVLMLVTFLLVAIALLCVRFTLLTVLEQDYREIGVLKALGVRDRELRRLYHGRYVALATVGAVVGLLVSSALTPVLLRDVSLFMGPAGRTVPAVLAGVLLSALVVGLVALAVRHTLRRLDRVSPVHAIRTGAATDAAGGTGPARLSVARSQTPTTLLLGLRDLLSRPARYAVPLVIYTFAAAILILPPSLLSTTQSSAFIRYMGAGVSDVRVDVQQSADPERVDELDRELRADPRVERHTALSTAAYTAPDPSGRPVSVKVESGDLAAFPVIYLDGEIPRAPGELALSQLQADALEAGVGDEVVLSPGGGGGAPGSDAAAPTALELTVTGIYQDITNGGRTAKMVAPHTSTELMWTTVYADLVPGTDVAAKIGELATAYPELQVSSVQDYVDATIGGTVSALRDASAASLAVGLLVAVLVTALFMRMLMARDTFPIAVMRALGFRDGQIRLQYVVRSVVVLTVGVALGAALTAALGGQLAGLLLSAMGISRLTLVADPWTAYVATPAVLLLAVLVTTWLSTRPGSRTSIASMINE